jgi:hypothetical protein
MLDPAADGAVNSDEIISESENAEFTQCESTQFESSSAPERMQVKLRIPSESEECGICLDKMHSCEVQGFEGLQFQVLKPKHRKMTLECGHSFSVNALLVHWLTSPMRCPLCRAGKLGHLCLSNLPDSWQKPATDYLAKFRLEEEQNAANEAALIQAAGIADDMVIYNRFIHLSMYVVLISHDAEIIKIPLNFTQSVEMITGDFDMNVVRSDVRLISSIISKESCFSMELVVSSHMASHIDNDEDLADSAVVLAQSGPVRLPCSLTDENERSMSDFTAMGDLRFSRNGQNSRYTDIWDNSSFGWRWWFHDHKMLDTLTHVRFRIKMTSFMNFIAHEAVVVAGHVQQDRMQA